MAEPRRTSIPILYTRGTFYEVGYDIVSTNKQYLEIFLYIIDYHIKSNLKSIQFFNNQGRTFQALIEDHIGKNEHLNTVLLQKYTSHKVRRVYENILKHVETVFPQYIDELRGIAAGSKVPFFKVGTITNQISVANFSTNHPRQMREI